MFNTDCVNSKDSKECESCQEFGGSKTVGCYTPESAADKPSGEGKFNEEQYLNDLWECYSKGIKTENLTPRELFIALIRDLLYQIK